MTRIQRARALRLGFILASLLCASVASARPQDVPGAGFDPKLDQCWESAWASHPDGGAGFERSLSSYLGMPFEPSRGLVARCEAKADLDYWLANEILVEAGGPVDEDRKPGAAAEFHLTDPDAAWENSYAACVAE